MKNLNPQAQRILDILWDMKFHCPSEWGYADGHCKRITDINKYVAPQGFEVIGETCNCGHHFGKLKKRKLQKKQLDKVDIWINQWKLEEQLQRTLI